MAAPFAHILLLPFAKSRSYCALISGFLEVATMAGKNKACLKNPLPAFESRGRRYSVVPDRFSIGLRPINEATSWAELNARLFRITNIIHAVFSPIPRIAEATRRCTARLVAAISRRRWYYSITALTLSSKTKRANCRATAWQSVTRWKVRMRGIQRLP